MPGALGRHSLLVMLMIVAGLAALGLSWETIQANNGLGWDGVNYATPPLPLSPYYAGRLLPIMIAGALPFEPVEAWRVLAFLSSVGTCLVWWAISERLDLQGGRWLGFTALFLTFQAKQFYFDPVLVDAFAEFAAMLMLLCHLRKDGAGLFFVTLAASFCWPVAGITGAALLIFAERKVERSAPRPIWLWLPMAAAVPLYAIAWYLRSPLRSFATGIPSYVLAAAAIWTLLDKYRLRHWWGVMAFILPATVISLAPGTTNGGSLLNIASYIPNPPSGLFFLPLVGLAVYYGPGILLAALHWPRVAASAKTLGITLPIIIGIVMALTTEPRHFLFTWPFLVTALAHALDRFSWRFAVLAILWSQFWLPINYAPWTPGTADVHEFPKQLWFMHFGYWMSPPMFALQAGALLLSAFILWRWPLRENEK